MTPIRLRRFLTPLLVLSLTIPAFAQVAPVTPSKEEKVLELSPFVVSTEGDIGYYATHSMAGTRLNSPLADIPGSITVITRAQLEDTASIDINDIFLYEANTEGTHTYTEFSLDRYGAANDMVQSAPDNANRVRGIGSADVARDYFVGLSGIPFDSYNVDRLTINRGPNSVLYGLGSPSGLVNASPAQANIGTNKVRVELRASSYGGLRGSIDINRTVIPDKLALHFSAMSEDRGIQQEPAFERTDRQYFAANFRPFKKTTIRGSYEKYHNTAQRAAAVTPADLITPWIAAGRPMWNPNTLTATYANGTQIVYPGTDNNLLRAALPGLAQDEHVSRPYWVMDNGQLVGPRLQRRLGTSSTLNLDENLGLVDVPRYYTGITSVNQPERLLFSNDPKYERNFSYPGYIALGISDKSVYDWDSINISAANFYERKADIYQFSLEQQVTDNLFVELAYHHESLDSADENGISANQAKVYIDVNSHNLDGTVNPYAGVPFMESRQEVDAGQSPSELDVYRATLAYQFDAAKHDALPSWLGRHNLMGLAQRSETWDKFYRYRPGQTNWNSGYGLTRTADGTFTDPLAATNPQKQSNRRYYLGTAGNLITHSTGQSPTIGYIPAPGEARGPDWPTTDLRYFVMTGRDGNASYPVSGGAPVGTWVNEPETFAYIYQGGNSDQQKITSFSSALQSYFWGDRIITTLGWRKDKLQSRTWRNEDETGAPLPTIFDENTGQVPGDYLFGARNPAVLDLFPDPWDEVSGTTTSRGVVFRPLHGVNRVPAWLRGLAFHYNESDSFEPSATAINLYGDTLINPTGTGKDWGISLPLLDDKLNIKLNFYKAEAFNSRNGGDTSTVVSRVERVENESNWGFIDFWEWNIELRDGLPLGTLDFFDINNQATVPYVNEIYALSGLPPGTARGTRPRRDDVANINSKGLEFTLDYNPVRNLSLKFTVSRQESIQSGAAPYTAAWIDDRWSNWTATGATNANFPMNPQVNWFTGLNPNGIRANVDPGFVPGVNGTDIRWVTSQIPSAWILENVMAPFALMTELNGKPRPQVREWHYTGLATYKFLEGRLRGLAVGGSVRWEDKASIGFMGDIDSNGKLVLDSNRPVFDDANMNFDFWTSYETKIMNDKVRLKVQLNVRNIFENGGLQPIRANPDGQYSTYRIVEPRTWYLTTSFEF